jgi:hypothetical protein
VDNNQRKGDKMNLQDLAVLLAAVELAVKRGTFSVLEIGAVGAVAEKLNAFLADAKRQQDEAAAQAATEGEAPAEAPAAEAPPAPEQTA